ncbi:nucleoside-diphosphate sugar epimerase/dehydratase [Anaeromyxobacter diazotrophicus]|uniref:Polysaccharide biosynthesis protein n=1 Tax=Anaeromyxobacter diazotrophicus TaxID=2590199 RepID=A0A7I9VJC5_9BACT|nr:nucleoside-diphosphate sugar epimerase/dehydratase [Anaeromyxobacter diazotrophicus]GEJ56258.1 polysaccharide biosynthesis protein [Anaeromyxobacter diazotrophicus]
MILLADGAVAVLALRLALEVRFEGRVPDAYLASLPRAALIVAGCRVLCSRAASLDRWTFRLAGMSDALRVSFAALAGTGLFAAAAPLVPGGVPRSVIVLEFFLTTSAYGALRFGPRALLRWSKRLARSGPGADRTVIIGDGSAAELLGRDLERSTTALHQVVGVVCSDRLLVGSRLAGLPVLGVIGELPALIARHRVSTVLLAERCGSGEDVRRIIETCAACRVRFKIVPASFDQSVRLSASMLADVSPADLLPRDSVAFDEEAIRALVADRRALVTGAGGTIGGELCAQLARFGARQLVMVDMNENELYLGSRRLAARHPELEIRTEVADVRDADALLRLGERYRPQDVFHAAAHKHVPLMELAPDEAVKNNVFGTLNAARMADGCGAERFVLISTDKAVKPTSVMGATKRVAELVVRDLGRSSRTRVTAVRFGNVLGSAGSVVPIFKEQIARGGPVTVTHAECTRYFMTISEAVGLTLLAGLGGYGDLCVLDMGEPIRIADLARYMITLAGRAGEVEVTYTGLRPGEKLHEELLTEDEERSERVRNRIHVTESPAPPPDLAHWLGELKRLAEVGDRNTLLAVLRALVPTYRPSRNVAELELLTTPAGRAAARRTSGVRGPAVVVGGGAEAPRVLTD